MPEYGHLIRQGEIPYRDFFLNLPPLQAIYHSLLESVAGRSMLAVRLTGVIGRLAIAGLLAAWLARRFRPATAALATLAAVWLASGDDTEILALYNHHALLAAIASGYLACRALDGGRWQGAAWLAAGVTAALSFWTKQTIGLGATLAVPAASVLLLVHDRAGRRPLVDGLGLFALGWLGPGAAITGWLATHGALDAFWRQTFLDAAHSKGSLWHLAVRPWVDPFVMAELVRPALVGSVLSILGLLCVRAPDGRAAAGRVAGRAEGTGWMRRIWWWGAPAAIALGGGWILGLGDWIAPPSLREAQRVGVFVGAYGLLIPAAMTVGTALVRRLGAAERERLVQIMIATACGVTLALSWPAGEAIALPSLAVVIALLVDGHPRGRIGRVARGPAVAAGGYAAVAAVALKLIVPFGFNTWVERPILHSTERSALHELHGMRLSTRTRDCVDTMAGVIRDATDPGEPVFTYPDLPLFL